MNNIQKSAFFEFVGQIVNKKQNAHKHSGTRLLAKHEAEIRKAVEHKLTHSEIATGLFHIPSSPVAHLSFATVKQYVAACCAELNITRKNF